MASLNLNLKWRVWWKMNCASMGSNFASIKVGFCFNAGRIYYASRDIEIELFFIGGQILL